MKPTCSIDGCSKKAVGRGWCSAHLWRWRKHGSPHKLLPKLSLRERLESRVSRGADPDDCWEWSGAQVTGGYGCLSHEGKFLTAHRVSWELHNNAIIPEGMLVRHSCDNPPCSNPRHLLVGTYKDNVDDMVQRRRNAVGERQGGAILTEDLVRGILVAHASGERPVDIAHRLGFKSQTIYAVTSRRNWKHVELTAETTADRVHAQAGTTP